MTLTVLECRLGVTFGYWFVTMFKILNSLLNNEVVWEDDCLLHGILILIFHCLGQIENCFPWEKCSSSINCSNWRPKLYWLLKNCLWQTSLNKNRTSLIKTRLSPRHYWVYMALCESTMYIYSSPPISWSLTCWKGNSVWQVFGELERSNERVFEMFCDWWNYTQFGQTSVLCHSY